MMKKGPNAKDGKVYIEDGISGLSDEILGHILSYVSTRDAVRTSALSHRWTDVWTSVPNLDLYETSEDEGGSVGFVDRVLLFHGSSNIHKLRIKCHGRLQEYISRLEAWISAPCRRIVVELELDLSVYGAKKTECKLSSIILMCKKLVALKLHLKFTSITITPSSNCFPCLRFLLVKVFHPKSHLMESLFSCCPVLEDLVIDIEHGEVLCFNVSAPKLKRLQITLDTRTLKEYDLPRSYNLKHLDLLLEACCSWECLTKLLSLSPNLECLVLECNIKCSLEHSEDHLVHQWCLLDCVPICLLRLKTICIWGFQGRPDEIEMVEYFLKHGEVLSNVTIHDSTIRAGSSMRVLSMLLRASKSCQLKFQK